MLSESHADVPEDNSQDDREEKHVTARRTEEFSTRCRMDGRVRDRGRLDEFLGSAHKSLRFDRPRVAGLRLLSDA